MEAALPGINNGGSSVNVPNSVALGKPRRIFLPSRIISRRTLTAAVAFHPSAQFAQRHADSIDALLFCWRLTEPLNKA